MDIRFYVQALLNLQKEGFIDYRGYARRLASDVIRKGDLITTVPSGFTSVVNLIQGPPNLIEETVTPMSISITLEDDIDISRGDMIIPPNHVLAVSQDIEVILCWLHNNHVKQRAKYTIRHTTNEQTAIIKEILYKIDINTLARKSDN